MGKSLLEGLKENTNFTITENGAITHKSTLNKLLDMFAFGGAYRNRNDEDCIFLFKRAFEEEPLLALKCLFYLRDIRGGQGERRFFRVCMKWFAENYPEIALNNADLVPEYGRWDDLYVFVGTPIEKEVFHFIKMQLAQDILSLKAGEKTSVSLLGKWLKSCNASSETTNELGQLTRKYLGMTQKQYRKTLSKLRSRINVVEKLMSENRWDEIEFDKLPSKAGIVYRNAFARRDIIKEKYACFVADKNTKVNAKTLYPYEVVCKADRFDPNDYDYKTERMIINKYWDNLTNYFENSNLNALCVIDTSGSMTWNTQYGVTPLDVAVSLGLYCAERNKGPFANHYISFASRPQLIETEGVDFVDKVQRIYATNLVDNTNIEAVFDLILNTAIKEQVSQKDLPKNIIIISDMEFDYACAIDTDDDNAEVKTLLENISHKWSQYGYEMPHLIFWNVDARQNNIPMLGEGRISFVSGFSPATFETIMSGKTGMELCLEKLNSERYAKISI